MATGENGGFRNPEVVEVTTTGQLFADLEDALTSARFYLAARREHQGTTPRIRQLAAELETRVASALEALPQLRALLRDLERAPEDER